MKKPKPTYYCTICGHEERGDILKHRPRDCKDLRECIRHLRDKIDSHEHNVRLS